MKTPSSKLQAPEKLQTPGAKKELDFGAWCFSGVWSLEIGAF
jgi:hypothetical protein